MLILSTEQQHVINSIIDWFNKSEEQVMVVSGYAGCGKTTIMTHLPHLLPDTTRLTFNAYTGKATSVMYDKLKQSSVWNVNVSTIHTLIYTPNIDKDEEGYEFIDGWTKNETIPYDLIIVDESSMISEEIFKDLIGYDKPILFIGDSAQLPPIVGDFNVMNSPDMKLTTIHRQAAGNPIIQMSQHIREHGRLPRNLNTSTTKEILWYNEQDKRFFNKIPFLNPNIVTLSALNKTRKYMNTHIRNLCGYHSVDVINNGERVVCLKNNDVLYNQQLHYIANGMMGTVKDVKDTPLDNVRTIDIDFDIYKGSIPCISDIRTFGETDTRKVGKYLGDPRSKVYAKKMYQKTHNGFDYGYCVTCHKSQGSQWPVVIVIDERSHYSTDDFYKRWLYTAVTRAEKKLFILKGFC